MPWFTRSQWIGLHQQFSEKEADKALGAIALEYLRHAVAIRGNDGRKSILLSHLMINGARVQKHQPLIGEEITLGQYDLPEAGFYAGILGHVHLKQTFENQDFFIQAQSRP